MWGRVGVKMQEFEAKSFTHIGINGGRSRLDRKDYKFCLAHGECP